MRFEKDGFMNRSKRFGTGTGFRGYRMGVWALALGVVLVTALWARADETPTPTLGESVVAATPRAGRGQWTREEAWAWNDKVGVIRGFNEFGLGYPGMTRLDVMRKAQSLGYNSVRAGDFYPAWKESPDKAKERLRHLLQDAQAHGLRVAVVLLWNGDAIKDNAPEDPISEAKKNLKAFARDFIGAFRDDERILLWDVFNEPNSPADVRMAGELLLAARKVNPLQPLTTSVLFLGSKPEADRVEVEKMADIHNFHQYDCCKNQMGSAEAMIACLKQIADRPIVCTECLARPTGDTLGVVLPFFSKHGIHWFNWGLYTSDSNWTVTWKRSTFDSNEPWFHDILHPDGTPYDWRDLDLIRNFHFAKPGENPDPGVEVSDRWLQERAWKWFVLGPMRGCTWRPGGTNSWKELWQSDVARQEATEAELAGLQNAGCDGLRVRLDYEAWKADPKLFCQRMGDFLAQADRHGMAVTPVLLTDADAAHSTEDLTAYVAEVIRAFARDGRIFCWELYHQPGAGGVAPDRARALLQAVFRAARFEFPGQPLTATPAIRVEDFAPDFDYRRSLAHMGGLGIHGWDKLTYPGAADASLCAYIWSLSDVLAFSSDQKTPETGWMLSVANRYGRPVLCTEWLPADAAGVEETLNLFAQHHVRWYSAAGNLAVGGARPATPSPLQASGLLNPVTLKDNENLARLVRQFHYVRAMTPR